MQITLFIKVAYLIQFLLLLIFSAQLTSSCTGIIQFTDSSYNAPTSWLWNFGDGTTSTLQNPSHTYTASGTFNVNLVATNNYGSNSLTKKFLHYN